MTDSNTPTPFNRKQADKRLGDVKAWLAQAKGLQAFVAAHMADGLNAEALADADKGAVSAYKAATSADNRRLYSRMEGERDALIARAQATLALAYQRTSDQALRPAYLEHGRIEYLRSRALMILEGLEEAGRIVAEAEAAWAGNEAEAEVEVEA